MYAPETILTRKNPKPPIVMEGKGENGSDIEIPFPYNRVRVINASPVSYGAVGSWEGADGAGVIITPLDGHGSTIDKPFGWLRDHYDVESLPERTFEAPKIRVVDAHTAEAGETPEQAFRRQAAERGETPSSDGRRGRTPFIDPLED